MDASTQFGMFLLVFFLLLLVTVIVSIILAKHLVDGTTAQEENQHEEDQYEEEIPDTSYVPPVLKDLSPEQIADIHSRGKITPAEYVAQWESTGMCWVISEDKAAPWCEHFRDSHGYLNCHDCLVAMANEADEHTSLWEYLQPYNHDI